jgi:peptide/nickel transport system ATP-binding protein
MILTVEGYSLDYVTRAGPRRVLDDITLAIAPGEILGLVGESGSGKSSLAWAITRALPANARETGGAIRLTGQDLRPLAGAALRAIRGQRIGMVFQDPATALNPALTLGRQLTEVLEQHRGLSPAEAEREAIDLLARVELRDSPAMMRRYPHEVSGGEKQRVVIATAFACQPELIIFDEPTTALDVITGARILDLFARLRRETGVAGLYISHDLALVARVADRVAVLDRGRIVEQAPPARLFAAPQHDYTRRLIDAVPHPDRRLVPPLAETAILLAAQDITVRYTRPGLFRRPASPATSAVSFDVRSSEILGLVGESGSGKSTIARALTGLAGFEGRIALDGKPITTMDRAYRRDVQIVFQHPDSSLNPRHSVADLLARPLRLFGGSTADIPRLLEQVRLPRDFAQRYPHQLSGGEKQRVAIARAFAARPRLVICDEITAALDVSVQAAVIDLLLALRRDSGTAYLFITHDLNLVRQIAHRIAVMQNGVLVDLLPAAGLAGPAIHPYTRDLMDACPAPIG